MKDTLSGFDDFREYIEMLQESVKNLEGQHYVSSDELFSPAFMSKYTVFSSIEELIQKSNLDIKSQEDFEKIPDDKMDSFVALYTSFLTWNQMFTKASEEWLAQQLRTIL